ncbi:MAG: hypothetical protein V7752_02795 [Halopseudomonas sp.]
MCLKRSMQASSRVRQRGLGLMAAIFVITIMSVIVVGVSSLVITSKESYGYEIMSVRAFQLAESGAQMAISHLLMENVADCSGLPSQLPPAELQNCSLAVECPVVTINAVDYFTLLSTATCGSGTDQAIRKLTLRVQR